MAQIDVGMSEVSRTAEEFELASKATEGNANDAVVELAEEIKEEFEDTAPVDTGEYRDSWFLVEAEENLVYLVNSADHAKYIVFPNSRFVGHPGADAPGRGIYHNIRGIAHSKKSEWQQTLIGRILDEIV